MFLKGGVDTPMHTMYFNFAIGDGMKYMKWLKNGTGNVFIFHAVFPALYPLL